LSDLCGIVLNRRISLGTFGIVGYVVDRSLWVVRISQNRWGNARNCTE
jgi:hypothetical protein